MLYDEAGRKLDTEEQKKEWLVKQGVNINDLDDLPFDEVVKLSDKEKKKYESWAIDWDYGEETE